MGVVVRWWHLKTHGLMSNVGVMNSSSMQILALHFKPIWVNPIRSRHEHVCICWIKSYGSSTVGLIPLKMCSRHGGRIGLLRNRPGLIRWRSFIVRWWSSRVVEIDSCYIMNTGSPLIFPSWKLPDKILLRMTGHLSRRSTDNKIARYVSPVPLAILLQAHQKQPAVNWIVRSSNLCEGTSHCKYLNYKTETLNEVMATGKHILI